MKKNSLKTIGSLAQLVRAPVVIIYVAGGHGFEPHTNPPSFFFPTSHFSSSLSNLLCSCIFFFFLRYRSCMSQGASSFGRDELETSMGEKYI